MAPPDTEGNAERIEERAGSAEEPMGKGWLGELDGYAYSFFNVDFTNI